MNIDWNAKGYQKDFAFVPKYGEAALDLIDAAPGALAVDLGCGNGGLTGKLIERRMPVRSNCRSRQTSSSATRYCTGSMRQNRMS